ncbi:MAG: FAD-dependent oxidoreductase [Thermodesulfovibrionales bacterium]
MAKKKKIAKKKSVKKVIAMKKATAGEKITPAGKNVTPVSSTKGVIGGNVSGDRVSSRMLEEQVQQAVKDGERKLTVQADGQHGIGGRIWPCDEKISITVEGPAGQRLGSMGMYGTEIVVKGSVSDDVGWINCGAKITVLGDVTNGAHNAGAQGILYVQGGGGARCDTMTKFNPRFDPLQSWYFRDVGDSFAEFKAGGTAVVCGVDPRNHENILGYRPCVGMVGGTIYFRGPIKEYSEGDVQIVDMTRQDWEWLKENMKPYLGAIDRNKYYDELARDIKDWKKIIAYTPAEKAKRRKMKMSMEDFRLDIWDESIGKGGMFAEYIEHPQTILPYITTGENRRNKPIWANDKYAPPCAANCPSSIPSHKRASLIRQGKLEEALELVLEYSPFPASVCGQVCPNLCMEACTRGQVDQPLNIKEYGSASLHLATPEPARPTGNRVAIIGGGPAGLSAAWQLAKRGHTVNVYEAEDRIGGKLELCIPRDRLPNEILQKELSRFEEIGVNIHKGHRIQKIDFERIYKDHEVVIVACGAHEPRKLKFPGSDDVISGIDFLKDINFGNAPDLKGKDIVVIGAGNAGMDIACQAYDCGASSVTAVDVQEPASFGKELELARSKGTKVLWPRFTEKYDAKNRKIHFTDGTDLDADIAIISIGEIPALDFLPVNIHTEKGWIVVNDLGQTNDVKVFAIGDATKPGLVTHAIGQGRIAAEVIHSQMMQFDYMHEVKQPIPYDKLKKVYYDVHYLETFETGEEANRCMSCGLCRDCHMCEHTCYYGAISRIGFDDGTYEYVVDADKCIGCGFCAGICPCGVWEMVENI